MSAVEAPAAVRARIEAALAVINAGLPDPDRAHLRAEREIERRCRTWPTANQVAALRRSQGMFWCRQRWPWVAERELYELAAEGGAANDDGEDDA